MVAAPQTASKAAARVPPFRAAVFGLLTAGYCLFFTWGGLDAPFSADEMMNLAQHWRPGPWRLFYANFLLWHDFYRPMGGWFYVPIYQAFGLRSLPYHAALLALLLLLVGLVYRLARTLGASPLEAWLAALIVSYHAGLSNLYYETSHVYDVLCAIFYAAALICYARARSRGRLLRARETALFFGLFLCALNSKEMAVTLPVMLLAYEWLYPDRALAEHGRRLRRFAVPAMAAAMTAVYVYGRIWKGLLQTRGYAIANPLARLAGFQRQEFRDFFFQSQYDGWMAIAAVWLLAAYFAWRRPRPLLRFAWVLTIVAPAPVEFLEGRGMAVLAIPLIGWAILASAAAVGLARAVAAGLEHDPGFRRLSAQARLALVLGAMIAAWAWWNFSFQNDVRVAMLGTGGTTAQVIGEFERLRPIARPRAMVVFLNDPFDGWDMSFIAELWFHDRSLAIRLQKKTPLTPAQLARADYIFDWRGGRLVAAGGATGSRSPHP